MEIKNCLIQVPAKIPRIAVYLEEELKDKVEQLAKVERRSLSQMCAILIEEAASSRNEPTTPQQSTPEGSEK